MEMGSIEAPVTVFVGLVPGLLVTGIVRQVDFGAVYCDELVAC